MSQTDVKSVTLTADGTAVAYRTRVKGVVITSTAIAGSVVLKDGGSGGTALLTVNTPAVASFHDMFIPGEGIVFGTDVYADISDVSSITIFYG